MLLSLGLGKTHRGRGRDGVENSKVLVPCIGELYILKGQISDKWYQTVKHNDKPKTRHAIVFTSQEIFDQKFIASKFAFLQICTVTPTCVYGIILIGLGLPIYI